LSDPAKPTALSGALGVAIDGNASLWLCFFA
jgi:hypothetical protein